MPETTKQPALALFWDAATETVSVVNDPAQVKTPAFAKALLRMGGEALANIERMQQVAAFQQAEAAQQQAVLQARANKAGIDRAVGKLIH